MRIVSTALLLACALAGCGVHWIYDKPGVTPDQLARDQGACLQESPSAGLFEQIFREDTVNREVFNRCMQRRGYSVRGED